MSAPAGAAAADRAVALNDAALELLLLAPDDAPRFVRIRELLGSVAASDEEPDWVREALQAASALLDGARAGVLGHESVVARVGALIELAMRGEHPGVGTMTPGQDAAAQGALPADAARELFPEFVAESLEYLQQAESALLVLESDPADREALNTVLRAFHTMKSTAGFLGLEPISSLAHSAESLLCRVRDDGAAFTNEWAGLTLECADMMRELVDRADAALRDGRFTVPTGYTALLERLGAAAQQARQHAGQQAAALNGSGGPDVPASTESTEPGGRVRGADRDVDGWTRVRTVRLDELVDLIGELVVAQSMVAQDASVRQDRHDGIGRRVTQTSKLVRQLQEVGMSLRMVPLRALFHRVERLTRDLTRGSGKRVELITEGSDTEIDRNMVDLLADPLVHMVRNALDHGIESPEERVAAGKVPVGTLRLAAFQAGGAVVLELHDDGRGLDATRILDRARAKGLVAPDRELTTGEIHQLIFAAGLSTADAVTALSGRGVGMDVVRRNIEALRGRIEIDSAPGRGTTFTVRLPLTLAITDGMLVRIGTERYVVPTSGMYMSVRPSADALVQLAGGGELVMLHGEMLPIIRLHALFAIAGAETDPTRGVLVAADHGGRRCALLVDELLGQQQFVVKAAGAGLGTVPGIAGGAVLGDGAVGLILDVPAVIDRWSA